MVYIQKYGATLFHPHNHAVKSIILKIIKITDHFTCTSANAILYNLHSLEKAIHRRNRSTNRQKVPRTLSRHREIKDDKNASKPVATHYNLPNHSKQHMAVCGLSLHQESTESCKTLEQIGTLNPHGIDEQFFSQLIYSVVFHVARHQAIA